MQCSTGTGLQHSAAQLQLLTAATSCQLPRVCSLQPAAGHRQDTAIITVSTVPVFRNWGIWRYIKIQRLCRCCHVARGTCVSVAAWRRDVHMATHHTEPSPLLCTNPHSLFILGLTKHSPPILLLLRVLLSSSVRTLGLHQHQSLESRAGLG